MTIKPIKTKKDYEAALKKIDGLFDTTPNIPEGDMLDVLVTLVEAYEEKHFAISPPNQIEAIKFRTVLLGIKQSDLADAMGGKNKVSEILSGKRELTAKMMRELHKKFNVPAESLLA